MSPNVAFSTLTTNVSYYVEYGGPTAPIRVKITSHPIYPPTYNRIDEIYLVFKWNAKWDSSISNQDPGKTPEWFQLHLFKPQGDDPGATVPPLPVADPVYGFRVTGDNPIKEDSDLWKNYISIYYQPSFGNFENSDTWASLVPERENTTFPGNRNRHKTVGPLTTESNLVTTEPVPLRVSTELITKAEYPHTFLLLLEIKRNKRLQLVPMQILVKSKKSTCFIATAAYGNPLVKELCVLRNWRDKTLRGNIIGRGFVHSYYILSPPIARIISNSEIMRKYVRGLLSPIVNAIKRRHPDWITEAF